MKWTPCLAVFCLLNHDPLSPIFRLYRVNSVISCAKNVKMKKGWKWWWRGWGQYSNLKRPTSCFSCEVPCLYQRCSFHRIIANIANIANIAIMSSEHCHHCPLFEFIDNIAPFQKIKNVKVLKLHFTIISFYDDHQHHLNCHHDHHLYHQIDCDYHDIRHDHWYHPAWGHHCHSRQDWMGRVFWGSSLMPSLSSVNRVIILLSNIGKIVI